MLSSRRRLGVGPDVDRHGGGRMEPDSKSESESGQWSAPGPGAQATAVRLRFDPDKRLVCAEYPGAVRDQRKMLETLGGEEGVSR
eukprot:g36564.t1